MSLPEIEVRSRVVVVALGQFAGKRGRVEEIRDDPYPFLVEFDPSAGVPEPVAFRRDELRRLG